MVARSASIFRYYLFSPAKAGWGSMSQDPVYIQFYRISSRDLATRSTLFKNKSPSFIVSNTSRKAIAMTVLLYDYSEHKMTCQIHWCRVLEVLTFEDEVSHDRPMQVDDVLIADITQVELFWASISLRRILFFLNRRGSTDETTDSGYICIPLGE